MTHVLIIHASFFVRENISQVTDISGKKVDITLSAYWKLVLFTVTFHVLVVCMSPSHLVSGSTMSKVSWIVMASVTATSSKQ